jgi:hypothetical protein
MVVVIPDGELSNTWVPGRYDIGPRRSGMKFSMVSHELSMRVTSSRAKASFDTSPRLNLLNNPLPIVLAITDDLY